MTWLFIVLSWEATVEHWLSLPVDSTFPSWPPTMRELRHAAMRGEL